MSYIMAVYNVGAYVEACMVSAVASARPGDEVLVVDDGSSDESPAILDRWAREHPALVRVVRQANSGLSSARNSGLAAARSDYLIFIDGDDAMNPVEVARARAALDAHRPDIVVTDFQYWADDGRGALTPSPPRRHMPNEVTTEPERHLCQTFDDAIPCVWTRFFHRNLFRQLSAAPFPLWSMYDDLPVTPHLVACAKSMLYIPAPIVRYRQRATSLTKTRHPRSCTDMVRAAVQASQATQHLPITPTLELAADRMLARKLMEAVRQTREVPEASPALVRELIQTATGGLHRSLVDMAAVLAASERADERAMAKHLQWMARAPATYTIMQAAQARYKLWRRARKG